MNSHEGRIKVVFGGLVLFAVAILGRAVWIQILPNPKLEAMAKRQFSSKLLVRPRRGSIVDRNGEPLAINVESNSLAADPNRIRNKSKVAWMISKAMDVPYDKALKKLKEGRDFSWIKRHLTDGEVEKCRRWGLMDSDGELLSGLWLIKESKRVYPHGALATAILGTVNVDAEGIEGVELWKEDQLKGKVVSVRAIKDAYGRPAFLDAAIAKEGKDGETVQLTLDASLQYGIEQDLRNSLLKTQARSGQVIVMNANNGELLGLANLTRAQAMGSPSDEGAERLESRRARSLTDGYEPGSTMKPIILAGLLNQGMKLTDTVSGHGGKFSVQGKKISEAETHEKYDWLSLGKVIQVSSNIGAAEMALRLGPDKAVSLFGEFGFGAKTKLGFPGEISGRMPTRKEFTPLRLANAGFGQGVFVTPMQMIRAYSPFANGGYLVQPTILKGALPTSLPHRVLSEAVAKKVVEALLMVTHEKGTGVKAVLEGYEVAGKTGTAQVVDPVTKHYSRSRYISSFIGFAAGLNQKILIMVALDEPKGLYYASDTAAPLFKAALASVSSRYGLPAQFSSEQRLAHLNPSPTPEPKRVEPAAPPVSAVMMVEGMNREGRFTWKMPDLSGLSTREVMQLLQGDAARRKRKFELELSGSGIVFSQVPAAGATLADGDRIRLSLRDP